MRNVTVATGSRSVNVKLCVTLIVLVTSASWPSPMAAGETETSEQHLAVIVQERQPLTNAAEQLIGHVGGRVRHQLPIIGGFAADLPFAALADVRTAPSVAAVWRDGAVQMAELDDLDEYDDLPPTPGWREAIGLSDDDDAYAG